MREFEDPWNRFAKTGKIEDYLSYRGCVQDNAASTKTGAPNTDGPLPEPQCPGIIYH